MRTDTMQAPFGATVCPVRTSEDAAAFDEWFAGKKLVAVDTETSGLDVFSPGWRLRLVQIGDADTAYVFEAGGQFDSVWRSALNSGIGLIFHNAPYDLHSLEMLHLFPYSMDTAMLSHLVDPSRRHGLKGLCADLLGADSTDGEKALAAHFRAEGWTKNTGWNLVDIRQPDYVMYAGLDAVLTFRLFGKLKPIIVERGMGQLLEFERQLAHLMAKLTSKGMLVDQSYTKALGESLTAQADAAEERTLLLGVENPRSGKQVREALLLDGVKLTKRTPSGLFAVDEEVLESLDHPLADALLDMRRAAKLRKTYCDGVLELLGSDGRSHPWIRPLGARTGRMSVANPPLQQLPSGDSSIRSMFTADVGMSIGASDYRAVELRVLAALSQEPAMMRAFIEGTDMHQATADAAGVSRAIGKMAGFLIVYGGGPSALATQAKITPQLAKQVMASFNKAYPGVKRWGDRLQSEATRNGYQVTTVTGRVLPLDRDRVYAATNYVVQSTARDVLAQALLRIDAAGLFDNVLMVVHDEVVWQAPSGDAESFAKEIGAVMSVDDFFGVPIETDSEVYGASWGAGYE